MHEEPLGSLLATIRQRRSAAEQPIHDQLQACQEEQATTRRMLVELQQRLDQLQTYHNQLSTELTVLAQQSAAEELVAARAALDASVASFLQMHAYWLAQAQLEQRIQTLYAQDPALDKKIEAHRKAESATAPYLETIPEVLREAVAQTIQTEIEKIRLQLVPWLDLQQQRRDLQPDGPLVIHIILVQPTDDELLYWVLPFPANPANLTPDIAPLLSQVANVILHALGSFGKHTDWSIDDLDLASWEGFSVLVALATYRGEGSIEQSVADLLRQHLVTDPLFQDVTLDLRIECMSPEAWRLGSYAMMATSDGVQSSPTANEEGEPADPAEDQPQPEEITSEWFTSKDLKLWSRKQAGKLLPQERRMRTLIVRMLGRGLLGAGSVTIERICQGLPPTHAEALRQAIALGVTAGVLMNVDAADGAGSALTLNPELLPDLQSLINREPSPLWASIVGSSDKSYSVRVNP